MIGVWRDFFSLDKKAKFELYPLPLRESAKENAKLAFKNLNLIEGKTILLFTSGNTWGTYSGKENFWIRLVEKIKLRTDCEIVTNSREEIIPNCKNVFLPLQETVAFVGLCGNVVSVPTGFAELACALNTKTKILYQVIYPDSNNDYWRKANWSWHLFRLPDLHHWGDDLIQKYIEDYELYMSKISFPNVTAKVYQLGNNDEEDEKLIDNLVEKIFDSTQDKNL